MSEVPFVDLGRQHEALAPDLREAFGHVLASGGFILGEEVDLFEAEFAGFCGVEHCIGVNSGTAALGLALQALGVGPGDEVVVPAHTFIASALGVIHAGATPVFCDVDDGTGLMDPVAANAACGERTAAILPVHLYGQCCDMDELSEIARRRGIALVEDAAQAHGATWNGRRAGSMGSAAAFSFYPSKNLGALGDGGAVCTSDPEVATRVRALRHLGQRQQGRHSVIGFNERLDGLQAAALRVKLPHLDECNERRRARALEYRNLLPHDLRPVAERPESPSIHHLFPVRTDDRDRLAEHLAREGVQTGLHYFPAAPDHEAMARWSMGPDAVPVARRWAAEELSLPMFAELSPDEVERVAAACGAFAASY
jgi:dTDP-4-amino-4,6-dideoxygalactose transaminase